MPFKAVSDPTRREILELLAERPRSVREIAELFPMSRPAISKHLRLLREAGLAVERKEGRRRFYSLQAEPLREVESWTQAVVARAAAGETAEAPPGRRPTRRAAARKTGPSRAPGGPARRAPASPGGASEADDWHVW